MKSNTLVFLFVTLLFLCNCSKNKYKYVEKIKDSETNKFSSKTNEFSSKNDSTAYMEAYTKFIASSKVSNFSKKKLKSNYKTPISFSIYNPKEEDITNYDFKTKKAWEANIRKKFNLSPNKNYASAIDMKKQNELRKQFTVTKIDQQSLFYFPKTVDQKSDSLFVVYMKQKDNNVDSLRIKFTYNNDVLTFAKKIIFTTENASFSIPLTNSISSLDKHIEGFDEDITLHKDLINALMKSDKISIKLVGYNNQEAARNVNLRQLEESRVLISQYLSLL